MKNQRLTIAILNNLVIAEAKKLRKNANEKELKRLDIYMLDTKSPKHCIYGQMTGDCFNRRASKLIGESCSRVFNNDSKNSEISGTLNGPPKGKRRDGIRTDYWSPIEVFIDKDRNKYNGNNERLITFLRGEEKTLKLK